MTDYLLALQERHSCQRRSTNSSCNLKEGDVVLIKDDTLPRLSWRKGKVEKLAAEVRVYQQRNKKTICIRRPIQHLVQLDSLTF